MAITLRTAALSCIVLAGLCGAAAAKDLEPQPAAEASPRVFTHAVVQSIAREHGDELYIRLKFPPRSRVPFTTQTLRVTDDSLVAGLAKGSWVEFTAARIGGENTLTDLHPITECKRFAKC